MLFNTQNKSDSLDVIKTYSTLRQTDTTPQVLDINNVPENLPRISQE